VCCMIIQKIGGRTIGRILESSGGNGSLEYKEHMPTFLELFLLCVEKFLKVSESYALETKTKLTEDGPDGPDGPEGSGQAPVPSQNLDAEITGSEHHLTNISDKDVLYFLFLKRLRIYCYLKRYKCVIFVWNLNRSYFFYNFRHRCEVIYNG
jgi:hypothetical protein